MLGKKEFKLGTCSQVSIATSYICKVHSSNCCRFLLDAVWLTTLHVNTMSHLVEIPRLTLWNAMSCHMEIPRLISWNAMSRHVEMPCLVMWK